MVEFKLKKRIITKLFAGYEIDPPLRFELNRSSSWKADSLDPKRDLAIVPFNGKEYWGIYLNSTGVTLEKLQIIESEIVKYLKYYCPKYNTDHVKFEIFSQVFVA